MVMGSKYKRQLRPLAAWGTILLSLALLQGSSPATLYQSLALSVNFSSPDNRQIAKAAAPSTVVPMPAPWQGPVEPVILSRHKIKVLDRLKVKEPVVFLGIDDGWYQTPQNLAWLTSHHLPFSLFLVDSQIQDDPGYFRQLQGAGMTIEDHSSTHPDLVTLDKKDQTRQICQPADDYARIFGRRPTLLRPPYGDYNDDTKAAAAACHLKALVNWDVVIQNGAIQYQNPSGHLEPGDVILTHFQSDLIPNMNALATQLRKDHLQIARLEDWLR